MNFDEQRAFIGLGDQPNLFSGADPPLEDHVTQVPSPPPPIPTLVLLLFAALLITCPRFARSQPLSSDRADPGAREPVLAIAPFDAAAARRHQDSWAEYLGLSVEVTNSIGMKLRLIPPGEFMMGSTLSVEEIDHRFPGQESWSYRGEYPRHRVRITRPYFVGTYKITVADFQRFVTATDYVTTAEKNWTGLRIDQDGRMRSFSWREPGFDQQPTDPVTRVSWEDAIAFCEWLSREEGRTYRLPTEAEWEYACRAGTDTLYYWGDDPDAGQGCMNTADETGSQDGREWTCQALIKNGGGETSLAGPFQPNAFGLHGMVSDVGEWCSDVYSDYYYSYSPVDDPAGPGRLTWLFLGPDRVIRGWGGNPWSNRSAQRSWNPPEITFECNGFRVVLSSADDR